MRKNIWLILSLICCLLLCAGCSDKVTADPKETGAATAAPADGKDGSTAANAAPAVTTGPDAEGSGSDTAGDPGTQAPQETPKPDPTPIPEPTVPPEQNDKNYYESELSGTYGLGDTIPNFGITLSDKRVVTIYALLEHYDCVMLTFWNSEENSSQYELTLLNAFNQQYGDRVAVLALSNGDSNDNIASFQQQSGLTIAMGYDEAKAVTAFDVQTFPTTVIIDRFHVAAAVVSGSVYNVEVLYRIADLFVGDTYTESKVMETIPMAASTEEQPEVSALSAALCSDGSVEFCSVDSEEVWPFVPADSGVVNSNGDTVYSECAMQATVTVNAGDVFTVSYELDIPYFLDYLYFVVDQEEVTHLDGQRSGSIVYAFPAAGTYTMTFLYERSSYSSNRYQNTVRLSEARLVSGTEAETLLAEQEKVPKSLVKNDFFVTPLNEGTREVIPVYRDGSIPESFTYYYLYLVPEDTAHCRISIGTELDADRWYAYIDPYDIEINSSFCTTDEEGFLYDIPVVSANDEEYFGTQVYFVPDTQGTYTGGYMLFRDEASFTGMLKQYAVSEAEETEEETEVPTWVYAEDYHAPAEDECPCLITLRDNKGKPAEGLTLKLTNSVITQTYTVSGSAVVLPLKENIHYVLEVIDGGEIYNLEKAKSYNVATSIGSITVSVPLK